MNYDWILNHSVIYTLGWKIKLVTYRAWDEGLMSPLLLYD